MPLVLFSFWIPRVEIYSTEAKKREKSARFLGVLKNRREKRHVEHESPDRNLKIHETIRMQMQAGYAVHYFQILNLFIIFFS